MMTAAPHHLSDRVQQILQQIDVRGGAQLAGTNSGTVARWLKHLRVQRVVLVVALTLSIVAAIVGLVFHEFGVWGLLFLIGVLVAFLSLVGLGVLAAHSRMMRGRLLSEHEPVVLSAQGIALRGIGPIPWSHLEPPRRTRIPVKNDIGGDCLVMTFTPEGHAFANQRPGWWSNRIGPKPYLRFGFPHLLLPGIKGLSDEEVMELFHLVHRRFAGV